MQQSLEEVKSFLTKDDELAHYVKSLLDEEDAQMKGCIRPISRQSKCPNCQNKYKEIPKIGYVCLQCKHKPTPKPNRFLIDIHLRGKRIQICSDRSGQALDSYQRSFNLLVEINAEIDNDSFDPSKYIKSEQEKFYAKTLLDEFLSSKTKSVAPSYKSGYTTQVGRMKTFFKVQDVRYIQKSDVFGFLKFLTEQKQKDDKPLRLKTILNNFDNAKVFVRWLKNKKDIKITPEHIIPTDDEVIEKGVIDEILEKEKPFHYVWFDAANQIEILDRIKAGMDREIVRFLMLSGCRPGEARVLKVEKVNIDQQSIEIDSTFSKNELRQRRKAGKKSLRKNNKKGAQPYKISIHPEMVDFFRERVKNNLPGAFVFVNPRTGEPYKPDAFQKIFVRVREKLNIPKHVRLYDATRHSFVTQLRKQGVPFENISKAVGHSSTKMTEMVYNHDDSADIEENKAVISKLSVMAEVVDIRTAKKKTVNRP